MTENKPSTLVLTHRIHYWSGNNLKRVHVTKKEADKAAKQWQDWRPVPIPNQADPERSEKLISPKRVEEIERITR